MRKSINLHKLFQQTKNLNYKNFVTSRSTQAITTNTFPSQPHQRLLEVTNSASSQRKMSKYTEKHLEDKLREKLGATYVEAVDESDGCGGKFHVTIVSEAFRGKALLQKHRLVNTALAEELKEIHAFSQKAYTPEEWEKVLQQQK